MGFVMGLAVLVTLAVAQNCDRRRTPPWKNILYTSAFRCKKYKRNIPKSRAATHSCAIFERHASCIDSSGFFLT
jgi:hypothetical protein